MSTWQISEADPSRCSTSKKCLSTERVRKFRLKQKQAVGYDHEQTKKWNTRERESYS